MRGVSVVGVVALLIGVLLPGRCRLPRCRVRSRNTTGRTSPRTTCPGCTRDASPANPDNFCFRMKSVGDLNRLDSPQIDVLILVPRHRRSSATCGSCGTFPGATRSRSRPRLATQDFTCRVHGVEGV